MSVPNHTILPATEADIPSLTELLRASKLQLAINRFLFRDWPAEAAQRENYGSAVEAGVKSPETTSVKVVHDASGKIVAHLYLRRLGSNGPITAHPSPDESDGKEDQSQVPDIFVPEVYDAVVEAMNKLEPEIAGDFIELTHIYVDPASRRRGIGTQLVRLCRDRAQAEGLPLTICAEPNHHDFFLKRGFRDEKYVDIDLRYWAAENSGYGIFRVSRMKFVMPK